MNAIEGHPVKVLLKVEWGDGKTVLMTGDSVTVTGALFPRELQAISMFIDSIRAVVKELNVRAA